VSLEMVHFFETFIEIENFCCASRLCVIGKPTIAAPADADMLSIGT